MKAPIKSKAEFEQLMQFASQMERPEHYKLLLLLHQRLGLRPMEFAKLQRSWFKGDNLRLPLGSSKRKSGRTLPINDEIKAAVDAHMGDRQGTVFLNKYGQDMTAGGISEAFRRLYRLAGIEGSCYSGRRSGAQRLLDKNANILVIQAFLGHKHLATTASYVQASEEQVRTFLFD